MSMNKSLDRLLDPVSKSFSVKTAKAIADLRADAELQAKMERLAIRCTEGELTAEEKAEYDALITANNVIAILQAKARAVIASHCQRK